MVLAMSVGSLNAAVDPRLTARNPIDAWPAGKLKAVQGWITCPHDAPAADIQALTAAAIQRADAAIEQRWPALEAGELVEVLLALQHLHYLRTDYRPAWPLASAAVSLARVHAGGSVHATSLLRRALSWHGITQSETGQHAQALSSLTEALQIASGLADPGAEAAVWSSLGVVMRRLSRFGEATACFERAVALSPGTGPYGRVAQQALNNLADCALYLGDLDRGIAAARQAIALQMAPANASEAFARVCAESSCIRLLLARGDAKAAQQHLEAMAMWTRAHPSPRAELMLQFTQGLAHVMAGHTDAGLADVRSALDTARRQSPAELHQLLEASIAAYRIAGQPEVALVYLHELQTLDLDASTQLVQRVQQEHLRELDRMDTRQPLAPSQREQVLASQRADLRKALGEREQLMLRVQALEQQCVMAEMHDDVTGRHCYRVGRMASLLAHEVGLEDDVCFLIDLAARLHDIGKLAVPDSILLKPGRLTDEERRIMQHHAQAGAEILARSGVRELHIAEGIARCHHERWDGTGYPDGLAGNAIPIAARITALADVFDALTHARPYKAAWSVEDALKEIAAMRGRHFDPALTDAFLRLVPRLQREVGDLDAFLGAAAKQSPLVQATDQMAQALSMPMPLDGPVGQAAR